MGLVSQSDRQYIYFKHAFLKQEVLFCLKVLSRNLRGKTEEII
jgi:hypothetical protein